MISKMVYSFFNGPLTRLAGPTRMRAFSRRLLNYAESDNLIESCENGEDLIAERAAIHLAGNAAVVVDVGANVGHWTQSIAPRLGAGSLVFCFEPTPATYEKLLVNLNSGATGVKINPINAALGNEDANAEIFAHDSDPTLNSLYVRSHDSVKGSTRPVTISIRRGDVFFKEAGVEKIDFLKIDVEGHEMAVLNGLTQMLSERRIGCVQFEYGGSWIDSRSFLQDAFLLFKSCNYQVGKVHPTGIRRFADYHQSLDVFQFSNYLAMREDWSEAFPTVD